MSEDKRIIKRIFEPSNDDLFPPEFRPAGENDPNGVEVDWSRFHESGEDDGTKRTS